MWQTLPNVLLHYRPLAWPPNSDTCSFMKIFTKSHSSEDLRWVSSENLVKIFRRKDFTKLFLLKIFKRSSKNFLLKSFWDLWNEFIWIHDFWKIFMSGQIFLRSIEDFLLFVLILIFKKIYIMLSNNQKWPEDLIQSYNSSKIFLRSPKDFRKIFIEDLLKISKMALTEIFFTSRRRLASYLRCG